ncbi:MAG: heparan-alpha-glucosaminide N-acetyltransferase [Pseudomonadota bacterium]
MTLQAYRLALKLYPGRNQYLDSYRGIIVLLMVGYHLCFDSIYFGYSWFEGANRNMNEHWGWLSLRAFIVGSFIFISALSVSYLPQRSKQASFFQHYKHVLILGLSAVFISLTSYWIFPKSWIDFGVLHFFFFTRLLLPWLRPLGSRYQWILAALIVALSFLQSSYFDAIPLRWIGLTTHKPITEDYVPLIPWLSVYLIGLALAPMLKKSACFSNPINSNTLSPLSIALLWLGQHSLFIYLVHQPLLWAIFNAIQTLR